MANITIDGQEYDLNDLSEKAKEQVGNLQFVQSEIKRLEAQLAVNKVAASVYSATLNSELKGVQSEIISLFNSIHMKFYFG